MKSPRTKRQDLRRAAGFANKPYSTNSKNKRKPKKSSTDPEEFHPAHATKPANVKASPDSGPMSNLGMPSRVQYNCIEEDYLKSLHIRKREKALLNQALFDKIWDVLHDPQSILVGTPQFRWWVRKMFVLSYTRSTLSSVETHTVEDYSADSVPVVLHENRPVALKDQIYDVLCYCHDLAKHGGRDKTTAVVREHYSWIPKELIAQFVKACPTCVYKKTGNVDLALAMNTTEGLPGADACNEPSQILSMPSEEQSQRRVTTHCVSLRVSDLISRDSASPSRDLTQYWPTTSGPLHSPAPVHPMPPLQSWMDTALYNTQDTSSHASEGSSTLVSGTTAASGYYKFTYELPPMRKHGSDNASYDHAGLRLQGRGVTLPPITKMLSEGAVSKDKLVLRPTLNVPDGFGLSPPPTSSSALQQWYHGGYNDRPHEGTSQVHHRFDAALSIDPALLQHDDVFSVRQPLSSGNDFMISGSGSLRSLAISPLRGHTALRSLGSFGGSSSLENLALCAGSLFAPDRHELRSNIGEPLFDPSDEPPRFGFPTSLERDEYSLTVRA